MRIVDPAVGTLVRGPVLTYGSRVEAWRDGRLELVVPVQSGKLVQTAGVVEAHELTLTIPAGPELRPTSPRHPLAAYGQRLRLVATIAAADGVVHDIPIGWYRIEDSPVRGDAIELVARDPSASIEDARLVTPRNIGGDYGAGTPNVPLDLLLYYLLATLTPHWVDPAIPNRTIGPFVVQRDRYAALVELLEVYGATGRWDMSGALVIAPTPSTTGQPVLTFDDGARGTVIADVDRESQPSRRFNACIAEGATLQGAPVYGGATIGTGPMAWPHENYNALYGFRPGFYASQLLTTPEQCVTAARSVLARWQRGAQGVVKFSAVPDPRLQTDDVVTVTAGGRTDRIVVTRIELPLGAADGAMAVEGAIV